MNYDMSSDGDWQVEIDEIGRRGALAARMGGAEKLQRQRDAGRLNVRERIEALLDPGSFHETGALAGRATYEGSELVGFTPANFVTGRGLINGRPVVVGGDDFTVRGGAADASITEKQIIAERMAHDLRMPLVRLIEGTGGGGSVKSLDRTGRTYVPANPGWDWVIDNLATVPVITLALGPVAGLGAARAVSSHYSMMVHKTSQIFVAGPPVVARAGEHVDKEELGGSHIHARNGVVDDAVESEREAFERVRTLLSLLPSSVFDLPSRATCNDDPERREDWLKRAIPRNRRRPYDLRAVIHALVDLGSFFELGKSWGHPVVTGLARLDGWPVAVLATDPNRYGGGWTADASDKVVRFVDLADTFHLPVVHLVDIPGFLIGTKAERDGTIRRGARALAAIYQASVPWCSVILRRAFGVAGAAHQNASRLSYRYAWPSGDWGSLPLEGGVEAAFKAELQAAQDPTVLRAEIEERLNAVRSPFRTAEAFLVEELIDPRDTRPLLCEFANLTAPLRIAGKTARGLRP